MPAGRFPPPWSVEELDKGRARTFMSSRPAVPVALAYLTNAPHFKRRARLASHSLG